MKNIFGRARIKLTLIYLAIIMAISLFFSFNIYGVINNEIKRRDRILRLAPPREFVDQIRFRIIDQLIFTNLGILLISGISGYWLAGLTLQPIEEAIEEQKRFISDASHELRTPLTVIKTETEVTLRDKKLDLKNAKKQLISNLEETDKLKKLTDYILTLNRLENDLEKEKKMIDLDKTTKEVIDQMKIKVDLKTEPVKIMANKISIEKLLTIFLDNAIKYSPKNAKIAVKIGQENGRVIMEIKDNGMGIKKSDIPYIFNRFYRADTSRSKNKIEGYGLGLAIAKSIVEAYKGKIEVESEIGKGSVFRVIIPC
jgi:two-component system, OmpR family, sensor histidine kinase CiaH